MTVIDIDETTEVGKHILCQLYENPQVGKIRHPNIRYDENGIPQGYTPEEVFAEVDRNLSETYGIDFTKVSRMLNSGELLDDELTDELLSRPEFKCEPYPNFKSATLSEA